MTRRQLLKRLGIGAGAVAAAPLSVSLASAGSAGVGKSEIVSTAGMNLHHWREFHVEDMFHRDPLKAIALARTYLMIDPEWQKTPGFIKLALGPVGQYFAKSPESDWKKSAQLYGWTYRG